jgi:beta-glucosidase
MLDSITQKAFLSPAMPAAIPPYQDPSLPVDGRVADLLQRMTLEEKCGQIRMGGLEKLQLFNGAASTESLARMSRPHPPGIVRLEAGADCATNAAKARDLHEYTMSNSRLGIPPLFVTGGASGVAAQGATIFPCQLALGATWDVPLAREVGAAIALEAAACGATVLLAPSFALARDPRFGGISQCFGECPAHTTAFGLAYLEGLQGAGTGKARHPAPGEDGGMPREDRRAYFGDVLPPNKVFGAALNFTGWGVPDGGLFGAPVSLSARALRALHFPPFEDAVRKGRVQVVVPVISPVNSVPGHANEWLLEMVLRKEWDFEGMVLGAPGGVAMNETVFGVAPDAASALSQALAAGVDVEDEPVPPAPGAPSDKLAAAVRAGRIPAQAIERAAARVLRLKFNAGLFEGRRVTEPGVLPHRIHTAQNRALALRAAQGAIVLLKNADGLLPLDTARIKTLGVIGPNAARSQFGDGSWSREDEDGVTILQGLRNFLGNKTRVLHSEGCGISMKSRAGFEEAVAIAGGCDAVLVVLGDESGPPAGGARTGWRPHSPTAGAGYDVANPVLPGIQEELVRALWATGRPIIALFLQGRPCSTPWIKDNANAILSLFYAGEEQGAAVASVLFGEADPGGRLPVSVARGAGSIPTTYDYNPGARGVFGKPGTPDFPGRDYVFTGTGPLWPFGFGLSYARFQYSNFVVETPEVPPAGSVRLRITATNISERDGVDVLQIYHHNTTTNLVASPAQRLVAFQKIALKAGAVSQIFFEFPVADMAEWDRLVRSRVASPGEYEIFAATSAEDVLLRGKVRVL